MIAWCALQRAASHRCLRVKLSLFLTQLLATTASYPFSDPGGLLSGHYTFHSWAADITAYVQHFPLVLLELHLKPDYQICAYWESSLALVSQLKYKSSLQTRQACCQLDLGQM